MAYLPCIGHIPEVHHVVIIRDHNNILILLPEQSQCFGLLLGWHQQQRAIVFDAGQDFLVIFNSHGALVIDMQVAVGYALAGGFPRPCSKNPRNI